MKGASRRQAFPKNPTSTLTDTHRSTRFVQTFSSLCTVRAYFFWHFHHRKAESIKRCQHCQRRVALADTHCSSYFFWNDYSAEVVYSSHYSRCFHLYNSPWLCFNNILRLFRLSRLLFVSTVKNIQKLFGNFCFWKYWYFLTLKWDCRGRKRLRNDKSKCEPLQFWEASKPHL